MSGTTFDQLPSSARLWIFACDRALSSVEAERLLADIDVFLDDWTAHRAHLTAARDFRYDRFLMVGVDESQAGASGCSIDSLVRHVKQLEQDLGVTFVDSAPVLFREAEGIQRVSRDQFAELAESGAVTLDTLVFDNTVATVGDLRAGCWEVPAREAWQGQAFFETVK